MARLYEYQAKELLRQAGVKIPEGGMARTTDEVARLAQRLGGTVAVKVQVLGGRRGKGGGVRIAHTPEEATQVAAQLLAEPFNGQGVEAVLVEQWQQVEQELYAAVTAHPSRRQPLILFSHRGGMEIEELLLHFPDQLHRGYVNILEEFHPYRALEIIKQQEETAAPIGPGRRKGELNGPVLVQLAEVVHRLYQLYRRYDCKLVEVNPLAVTPRGVIALDARIDLDDDALSRHPELGLEATEECGGRPPTPLEQLASHIDRVDHRGSAHFVQIDPDGSYCTAQGKIPIGFNCVGTGASLTTMDELVPLGYYPVNFCDSSGAPSGAKLYRVTRIIFAQPHIRGYLFLSCVATQRLHDNARGIIKALKELYPASNGHAPIPCLFVFRGGFDAEAIQLMHNHGIAQGRWVRVLGRQTTERQAAQAFHALFSSWQATRTAAGA